MAAKIILFLSDLKQNAAEKEYLCPNGGVVTGVQTNDAPVRYLLQAHPTVRRIICVVTKKARLSAWDHFRTVVKNTAPAAEIIAVDYEEQQDFRQTAIPVILDNVRDGGEIYLDLTGGFRNANMHLLLLSRVLSYCGHQIGEAVYSNFNTGCIEDMSLLLSEFDLVAGMQELTNLGSVRTLRGYYDAHPAAPEIDALLEAMESLTEAITLCRTKRIGELMERFGSALEAAKNCEDPLMRHLLAAFQRTFGNRFSTPGLIKWCVRNDMLQQALTVYTERIPAYIFHQIVKMEPGVFRVTPFPYEDGDTVQFMRGFLLMSIYDRKTDQVPDLPAQLLNYVKNYADDIILWSRDQTRLIPPNSIKTGLENLALIVGLAYPDDLGGFQSDWAERLPADKEHLCILEDRLAAMPARTARGMLNSVSTYNKELLWALLEKQQETGTENCDGRVETIRDLERLLPGSGYSSSYPIEKLQTICRDYLYVKMLRNLANHANDELIENQTCLKAYLLEFGYPDPECIGMEDLRRILLRCLSDLLPPQKKEKKK